MEKIEKSILVNASAQTVFKFINDPLNLLKISPAMIEVTDVSHAHNGGWNFRCVARMADARIQYINECVEHLAHHSLAYKTTEGLHGAIRWLFEPENELTRVTLHLEYEVPRPLLKRHTLTAIGEQNEHEAEILLSNLKAFIERQILLREAEGRA